jgi:hypothetical protein
MKELSIHSSGMDMKTYIQDFVASCDTFQRNKGETSEDTRGIATITNPNTDLDRHFNGFYCGTPKSRKQIKSSWWLLIVFQKMLIFVP